MSEQQKLDHTKAPIVDAIEAYQTDGFVSFCVPGHKRELGIDDLMSAKLGRIMYHNDIAELQGIDDRKMSKGIRGEAEKLAADAFGSKQSYYSIGGTSLSIHVAMLTIAGAGDKVIVARNVHKSMVAALVLAEVNPIFIQPEINTEWNCENSIDPDVLEKTLYMNPDAKGVFIVSPTYYGITGDIKKLADICHSYHMPLIVDEAWGPHFPFHPGFPASAMSCGADMSMGSIHKTLTGLGQASVVNMQGDLVQPDRFELCLKLFESTSPSSLILASSDAARRQMMLHGKELLGHALELSDWAREELAAIEGIKVLDEQALGTPGAKELDKTKLVFDVSGLGVSGYEANDWLTAHHKLYLELMTDRHLMALITIADNRETVEKLITGVQAMAAWARKRNRQTDISLPTLGELYTSCVTSPAKAFFGVTEDIPFEQAAGRIAAEMVTPYPPGIPRITPGEVITQTLVDYLQKSLQLGMYEESFDPSLKKVRVVKRS